MNPYVFEVERTMYRLLVVPSKETRNRLEMTGPIPVQAEVSVTKDPATDHDDLFRAVHLAGIFGNLCAMAKSGIEFRSHDRLLWPTSVIEWQVSRVMIDDFVGLLYSKPYRSCIEVKKDYAIEPSGVHHIDIHKNRGIQYKHFVVQYQLSKGWGASFVAGSDFDVDQSPDFVTDRTETLVDKLTEWLDDGSILISS